MATTLKEMNLYDKKKEVKNNNLTATSKYSRFERRYSLNNIQNSSLIKKSGIFVCIWPHTGFPDKILK